MFVFSNVTVYVTLVQPCFNLHRFERILMMVYAVQSYWACFGLYPSSCMWKTKDHNVSETGSVSVLRWMGQDEPTHLGPLERASPVIAN
jgi:hypothetical protein